MNRALAACVLASLVFSGLGRARAEQAPRPGLNWVRLSGASACPSAPQIADGVEARLGRKLFVSARDAELFVDGYVAPVSGGFAVSLEISERNGAILGRRTLHVADESCDIAEAVTLVIAVTLYPDSALPAAAIPLDGGTAARLDALFGHEAVDPDPGALPKPVPASGAEVWRRDHAPAATSGSSNAPERAGIGMRITASGALGVGQVPGAGIGAEAEVTLGTRQAWPAIQLGLGYFVPSTVHVDRGDGEASFQLMLGWLSVCPLGATPMAALELCVGAEVGRLAVNARQFLSDNRSAVDLIVDARVAGAWYVRLAEAWSLRLGLVVSVPLVQLAYTYREADGSPRSLFRMPQMALRGQAGLAFAS